MAALKYTWRPATLSDIDAVITLTTQNFSEEITDLFVPDPWAGARNLTQAIVNQYYRPSSELVSVAVDNSDKIIAWTWAQGMQTMAWSDELMVQVRMAHTNMQLSTRDRVRLTQDMIALWEGFAQFACHKIVCSTTMREDQAGFLRIHQAAGYDVRGSYAYKRLTN
jgi:hypothetical protein